MGQNTPVAGPGFSPGDRTPQPTGRLRAIADRPDAGADLDLTSPEGWRRRFAPFEEASPGFKTYAPIFSV